jgi:uncharacterized protein YdaU (DUF1376 family)
MASSWFPFFGRDFLAATTGWTADERGHYVTLLIVQWEQDGLPDDLKRLEMISPGVRRCWKTIADKFPVWKDGKRRNTRLEHERSKSHERSERARQSASKRWAEEAGPDGDQPTPKPPDSQPDGCDGICDRICDGMSSGSAPMSMSYTPPPPTTQICGWEQDWPALRAAWNDGAKAGNRSPWKSATPPAGAADRLKESGWLEEALQAVKMTGDLKAFDNPVSLGQFCQAGWVAKVLGGYWRDKKKPPPSRQSSGYRHDDRPPPQAFQGDDAARFEATKRAMLEKLRTA